MTSDTLSFWHHPILAEFNGKQVMNVYIKKIKINKDTTIPYPDSHYPDYLILFCFLILPRARGNDAESLGYLGCNFI